MSTKKKRKVEGDATSSKSKERKIVQDEPSLKKKKKINNDIQEVDDVIDVNAMQTRIRTGTISKVNKLQFYKNYLAD